MTARLELLCGCREEGAGVWTCDEHNKLIKHDGEDACVALYAARAAISEHNIVTVTRGAGVTRIENALDAAGR